jgi:hypothetical protein
MPRFFFAAVAGLGFLSVVSPAHGQVVIKLTGVTREMLEKAEKFELLSLDPSPSKEKPKEQFHGKKVLGVTVIKDAKTRKQLIETLKKGIEENARLNPPGVPKDAMVLANCFEPRHGIRLTDKDKTVDLVICFHCLQIQVYVDGFRLQGGLMPTTKAQQGVFDKVLQAAKVPLAPKAEAK